MTRDKRILFTFLTDYDDDLNLARRHFPYEVLVLLVTPDQTGRAEDVAAREHKVAGPDACHAVTLPTGDMHDALDRLRTLLDDVPPTHKVTLNLAGAAPTHLIAAMTLAFERGLDTHMAQHDHVTALPILQGLTLHDRFNDLERTLLQHLEPAGTALADLAQTLLIAKPKLHKAARALKEKGLVSLQTERGDTVATLNGQGERMRAHLTAPRAAAIDA